MADKKIEQKRRFAGYVKRGVGREDGKRGTQYSDVRKKRGKRAYG